MWRADADALAPLPGSANTLYLLMSRESFTQLIRLKALTFCCRPAKSARQAALEWLAGISPSQTNKEYDPPTVPQNPDPSGIRTAQEYGRLQALEKENNFSSTTV